VENKREIMHDALKMQYICLLPVHMYVYIYIYNTFIEVFY